MYRKADKEIENLEEEELCHKKDNVELGYCNKNLKRTGQKRRV